MKTSKFIGILCMFLMVGTYAVNAQNNQGKHGVRKRITHEQISQMKANRLAEELALDDKTAASFKQAYIQYTNEIHQLWMKDIPQKPEASKENPPIRKERKELTDDEVEKIIKGRFAQSRKMLDIREKYYDVFRKFLSPKQIQKVYEKDFRDNERFHNEMNRRAGKKLPQGQQRSSMPQK